MDAPLGWGGRRKNATGLIPTAKSSWVESRVAILGRGFFAFFAFFGARRIRTLDSRVHFGRSVAGV